nr:MAG TPA: hypothetical protein [Caudoviricetes sp.]
MASPCCVAGWLDAVAFFGWRWGLGSFVAQPRPRADLWGTQQKP